MTAPHSTTRPDDTARKIDISLTQIAAAALAAVTAAVLGSRLGAAGTLIGAAGASVITNVATAVYRASLERSRARVRLLAPRTRLLPTFREGSRIEHPHSAEVNAALGDERIAGGTDRGPRSSDRTRLFARLRWGAVIVGALGAFGLAMLAITGFEVASGETVAGDSKGTSVGRVINPPSGPREPTGTPAPDRSSSPPSATPTETTTPTDTATTTPEGDASVEPSPSRTSGTPVPSEVRPTPPLLPTGLPRPQE